MTREGLTIESQTLWDQLDALATVLTPTYEALRRLTLFGSGPAWRACGEHTVFAAVFARLGLLSAALLLLPPS
jgi:hypothetical protein